jgi:hypothetical protein
MTVEMVERHKRGCGYRRPGNYIEGEGIATTCYRLPLEIPVCPCCGTTLKPIMSIQMINPQELFGDCEAKDKDHPCHNEFGKHSCYVCFPPKKAWVQWVSQNDYTEEAFIQEASRMGVSRRIATFPHNLKMGDVILLAYRKQQSKDLGEGEFHKYHQIFYAFRVTKMVKIITDEMARDEDYIQSLENQGIVPTVEYGDYE